MGKAPAANTEGRDAGNEHSLVLMTVVVVTAILAGRIFAEEPLRVVPRTAGIPHISRPVSFRQSRASRTERAVTPCDGYAADGRRVGELQRR